MTLKVLDLFAGAGGFTVAGELAGGYETVAFCEIDKHARKVLANNWPDVPIFEDVTKLKADDIDGTVDVITGGFPCQDLSTAGRGAGLGRALDLVFSGNVTIGLRNTGKARATSIYHL